MQDEHDAYHSKIKAEAQDKEGKRIDARRLARSKLMPMYKELPDYVKLNKKKEIEKGYTGDEFALKSGLDIIRKMDFTLAEKIDSSKRIFHCATKKREILDNQPINIF